MRTWNDLASDIINTRDRLAGWEHLNPRYSCRSVDGGQNVLLAVRNRGDSSYWAMFAVVEDDLVLTGGRTEGEDHAAQAMAAADQAINTIDPLTPPPPMPNDVGSNLRHVLLDGQRIWDAKLVTGRAGVNRDAWEGGGDKLFGVQFWARNTHADIDRLGDFRFLTERDWFRAVGHWVSNMVAYSMFCSPTIDEEKSWLRNLRSQARDQGILSYDACKTDNCTYWRIGDRCLLDDNYVPTGPWSYLEFRLNSYKVNSYEHPENDRKGVKIRVAWEGRLGYRSPETGCQTTWLIDWTDVGDTEMTVSVMVEHIWHGQPLWEPRKSRKSK